MRATCCSSFFVTIYISFFFNFCCESVRFLKEYIADHPEQLANAASRGEAVNGENPHRPDLVNEVARYSVTSHEN